MPAADAVAPFERPIDCQERSTFPSSRKARPGDELNLPPFLSCPVLEVSEDTLYCEEVQCQYTPKTVHQQRR